MAAILSLDWMAMTTPTLLEAAKAALEQMDVGIPLAVTKFTAWHGTMGDLRAAIIEAASVRDAALEEAANKLQAKADDYAQEYGWVEPDTGALVFGRGEHAEIKSDTYNLMCELADEVRAMKERITE